MRKEIRLRLLSNIVILYMLLAFSWWSVLLFTKNKDAYRAKVELLKLIHVAEGRSATEADFVNSPEYDLLTTQYKRQEWMIFGEAAVFVISLVIGVWMINRGYNNLMSASRQQSDFLLSITHELKSPLAAIRLAFETAQRPLNAEQTRSTVEKGLQSTTHLQNLVNNLLFAAKMESAFTPDYEEINLPELIESVTNQSIQSSTNKPNLQIDYPDALNSIMADREGMRSIIGNLIENALKYAGPIPEITIVVSQDRERTHIEVSDTGPGIPEHLQKKVFDKFYRHEVLQGKPGTGLGLFIVREMVRAHGGTIGVKSNAEKGCRFLIDLPNHT